MSLIFPLPLSFGAPFSLRPFKFPAPHVSFEVCTAYFSHPFDFDTHSLHFSSRGKGTGAGEGVLIERVFNLRCSRRRAQRAPPPTRRAAPASSGALGHVLCITLPPGSR